MLENAAAGKQALLIFFPGESEEQQGDGYLAGKDYKDLDGRLAQFVRVPYTTDREAAPCADSIVPTSKILSDNPTRDYNVKAYPTFIIADSYGNEVFRLSGKKPLAKELEDYFNKVSSKVEDTQKKLQKNLDEAKKAWESKDAAKAMKAIRTNFKDGVVGLDAQNETIRVYHEIVESTRSEISTLAADGSADAVKKLKAMKATFKGTEVEKNIDEALKASAAK
ncbi:MAG: hypothetical protein DCC64_10070 [Planctomycetota bacterium]|nr:MAG: hypothetical protein DCC64_10070 [Planctomycetota bacterium]